MHIKSTMRYCFIPANLLWSKSIYNKCWRGCGKLELQFLAGRNAECSSSFGRQCENSSPFKHGVTIRPRNVTYILKRIRNIHKHLYTCICSSIIHNQKVKTIQSSISWWVNKQSTIVNSPFRIPTSSVFLFSHPHQHMLCSVCFFSRRSEGWLVVCCCGFILHFCDE